ncbi:DUF551 domain-containing protein [Cronobacter dublinensis]
MIEISKERVEALASNILECHDVKPSEVKALAGLALLALRELADPVTVSLKLAKLFRKITNSEIDAEGNAHVILSPNETLTIIEARRALTAPPVPVVPDALEQFAEFMAAESIKSGDYPDGWQCKAANAAHEYAQSCRAAMLTVPGKQPLSVDVLAGALRNAPLAPSDNQGRQRVPVAAGWIACSERMPKIGDEIFYYCEDDGIRDCGIVGSSNFTGRGDSELFVHSEGFDLHLGADITHWMPLPAAPGKN